MPVSLATSMPVSLAAPAIAADLVASHTILHIVGFCPSKSCIAGNRGSSSPKNSSRWIWIAAGGNAGAGARD
jgi:hypothetical protein